jgi:hypothetical protein
MIYENGVKVRHKTHGVIETIVGLCKVKVMGVWVTGVMYEGVDRYTGEMMTFVRGRLDFENDFEMYYDE